MTQHSFLPVKVKSNFTEGWRRVRSRKRSGAFNARVKNMTRGGECVATVVQGGRGRMTRAWRSTFSFQVFTRIVQETQKKKALIHWHIKGRQTQSLLQINAHYSQNEPLQQSLYLDTSSREWNVFCGEARGVLVEMKMSKRKDNCQSFWKRTT